MRMISILAEWIDRESSEIQSLTSGPLADSTVGST